MLLAGDFDLQDKRTEGLKQQPKQGQVSKERKRVSEKLQEEGETNQRGQNSLESLRKLELWRQFYSLSLDSSIRPFRDWLSFPLSRYFSSFILFENFIHFFTAGSAGLAPCWLPVNPNPKLEIHNRKKNHPLHYFFLWILIYLPIHTADIS